MHDCIVSNHYYIAQVDAITIRQVSKVLNHAVNVCSLSIQVHDSSAFPRVAQALVTVVVTDLNDNSPTFTDAEVSRSLPESIAPQTLVSQPQTLNNESRSLT